MAPIAFQGVVWDAWDAFLKPIDMRRKHTNPGKSDSVFSSCSNRSRKRVPRVPRFRDWWIPTTRKRSRGERVATHTVGVPPLPEPKHVPPPSGTVERLSPPWVAR